jgi:hypothetical protein
MVGVAYGPHSDLGTEANTEVAKKRKGDAGVRSVGKWVKVAEKKVAATPKGTTAPKAAIVSKGTTVALSKPASVLLKATLKAGAPPKATAAKAMSLAVPSTVGGVLALKAATMRQQGPQSSMKAGMLKLKAGMKSLVSAEPSLEWTAKQSKAAKVSSSVPASTQNNCDPFVIHRVEYCSMLGVTSMMSSSISLSGESSASESA